MIAERRNCFIDKSIGFESKPSTGRQTHRLRCLIKSLKRLEAIVVTVADKRNVASPIHRPYKAVQSMIKCGGL